MPTMRLRLDEKTSQSLEVLAKAMDRSTSYLATRAIDDFVKLNAWQVEAIEQGVSEADVGNFVEHSALKQHWESRLANSLD
ncbi:hypothetical protein CCR95_05370 [Thiocystis minor]|uniref:CopG family ribbon-helix-helix protein n=1 Tax=Thiocystis minor TaxID=61597 RepID=UPI0019119BA6|nr:CopG family transcriptional regulator [Thiocystis minor]MBK5963533.1 hypothetical protein [Thiocystis minor]